MEAKNKEILIVDNDEEIRAMYAEVFRKSGFHVYTAIDGLEGFSLAHKYHPDIILSGTVMPRMDGFRMMEALKECKETCDIPVVVNSHLGHSSDRERAQACGARDFFVHEFASPGDIVERINAIVDGDATYDVEVDLYARDAEKLAKKLGIQSGLLQCKNGEKMIARITIRDAAKRTGTIEFVCE